MTGRAGRWIRWITIGCAGLLALIAGTCHAGWERTVRVQALVVD